MLLNNQWLTEESKEEIEKIPGDRWKQKHGDLKSVEGSKIHSKREVYSNTSLPQDKRKISNKKPDLTPKGTRKRRTNKPEVSRRNEIMKIRAEINEIQT